MKRHFSINANMLRAKENMSGPKRQCESHEEVAQHTQKETAARRK